MTTPYAAFVPLEPETVAAIAGATCPHCGRVIGVEGLIGSPRRCEYRLVDGERVPGCQAVDA
jgi:hypothetical protein